MFEKLLRVTLVMCVVLASAVAAQAVTIDMVTVGDVGNAADTIARTGSWATTSLGAVAYEYQIGKYEVTHAQYVEFLNAAAKSDPYGLYRTEMGTVSGKNPGIVRSGSSGSYTYALMTHAEDGAVPGSVWAPKPVGWISKWDGVRFANWMHNGQPTDGSGLQDGSYTLTGSGKVPDNAATVTRNTGATWVLPNDDEWHKAAYYKGSGGGYWDYPTQSDTAPTHMLTFSTSGVGSPPGANYANYVQSWVATPKGWYRNADWYRDELSVGTSGGPSFYGAYDMAGNVDEYIDIPPVSNEYLNRGSNVHLFPSQGAHVDTYSSDNRDGYSYNGFRLVSLTAGGPELGKYWAGGGGGGAGTWTPTETTWSKSITGSPAGAVQSTTDTLEFGATAGIVTIGSTVTVNNGLKFTTNNYEIAGASGKKLTLAGAAADNKITTNTNVTATINAQIDGDNGMIKDGEGTLVLNYANTYKGGTTVSNGTLELRNANALKAGENLTIGASGTVVLASDLTGAAAVNAATSATAVPEPGTIALLAAGLAGLLVVAWRRRR